MQTNKTNIAQLNVFVSDHAAPYMKNGYFTVVFQRELDAVVSNRNMSSSSFRVLGYLIAHVDNRNQITVTVKQIQKALKYSAPTIYRALDTLISMQLICRRGKGDGNRFELTSKLLNPRLAFYGNSQKLLKNNTPLILAPDGLTKLLPNDWSLDEIEESFLCDDQDEQ